MAKVDGGLRPLFKIKLESIPHSFHFQSIESHVTGKGTPDTNYCARGVEGWIEYKKTDSSRVKSFKPEQVAWCERRLRAGGRVFFAIRDSREDTLWLIRGPGARDLFTGGFLAVGDAFIAGSWAGGPKSWPWDLISEILAPKILP